MQSKFLFILIFIATIMGSEPTIGRENSSKLYKEGVALAKDNKLDEAIVKFQKVIEISPYFSLGHYGLGKSYLYKKSDIKLAIKELELAVKYDRKLARAYFYLGMAYGINKQYILSIKAYKKAYELDSSYIEALYNIGTMYETIGRSYDSYKYFKKYKAEKEKTTEDFLPF